MQASAVFAFWLGRLDTQVSTGRLPPGVGTRDIRFCAAGDQVRRFLLRDPDQRGRWDVILEPYPEAGVPRWMLPISEYRFRGRECALPGQAPTSRRPHPAYPLWQRRVRLLRRGEKPRDCILLVRDPRGLFHARVFRWEELRHLPATLQRVLRKRDECGRLLELTTPVAVMDLPIKGANLDAVPAVSVPVHQTREERLRRIAKLGGQGKSKETVVNRRLRSRRLAEELKSLYEYRCQLCDEAAPRIDMGRDRFYVEVHHIYGLSEVEQWVGDDQETGIFNLDNWRNIVVVCPHHHRLFHHYRSPISFDPGRGAFMSEDGSLELRLRVDHHLRQTESVGAEKRG